MKTEVISLGGSVLFQNGKVNVPYIKELKKLLLAYRNRKFVLVVGGGYVARVYIDALDHFNIDHTTLSRFGIAITRVNAGMVSQIIGPLANMHTLPTSIREVGRLLAKHRIVCCGGLRYEKEQTTDSTGVQLAHYLKTDFINLTDVKGLYTKNPKKHRNAKFVSKINRTDFLALTKKMTYRPGQHFVLDQHAAVLIHKHKIPAYIVGKNLRNLKNILDDKPFVGTTIH